MPTEASGWQANASPGAAQPLRFGRYCALGFANCTCRDQVVVAVPVELLDGLLRVRPAVVRHEGEAARLERGLVLCDENARQAPELSEEILEVALLGGPRTG
ncbi:unnamed protein product [Prorocentrum cordatum]|uniref:Uncharacterized protein n=1 Tax=Prorocentrum cordatum TaxID=2364126 RepID=A0ABN9YC50_9DINO|nr:unnamed protein product [Polarella glacialis]